MKLYDFKPAPNPRRVRIYLAEKGIEVPTVQIALREGGQFSEAYRAINPRSVVPALELDDGTCIGEAIAICRYFEEFQPKPALFGRDIQERAQVAMWETRAQNDGIGAVAEAFRNFTPAFEGRALPGADSYAQIPDLIERGRARAERFWQELDGELSSREYIAGDGFSMADITAFVMVGFAGWIKLEIPEELRHLTRWHAAISKRPSAEA